MKYLLAVVCGLSFASPACAATLVLPAFSVSTGASTGITCSSFAPGLVAPVAPGTVLASCVVAPNNWVGAVTQSNPALAINMTTATGFQLVVGAAPLAAGSYPATTITSAP